MKNCSVCQEDKALDEFYARSARCKKCHNEYTRQHYRDNKQSYVDKAARRNIGIIEENRRKLIEYLSLHPCVDCPTTDVEVLEFDHVDPSTKTYNVSNMLKHSWKRIEAEIEKCVVRCSNCHTKRTRRQFGWWTVDGVEPIG